MGSEQTKTGEYEDGFPDDEDCPDCGESVIDCDCDDSDDDGCEGCDGDDCDGECDDEDDDECDDEDDDDFEEEDEEDDGVAEDVGPDGEEDA